MLFNYENHNAWEFVIETETNKNSFSPIKITWEKTNRRGISFGSIQSAMNITITWRGGKHSTQLSTATATRISHEMALNHWCKSRSVSCKRQIHNEHSTRSTNVLYWGYELWRPFSFVPSEVETRRVLILISGVQKKGGNIGANDKHSKLGAKETRYRNMPANGGADSPQDHSTICWTPTCWRVCGLWTPSCFPRHLPSSLWQVSTRHGRYKDLCSLFSDHNPLIWHLNVTTSVWEIAFDS